VPFLSISSIQLYCSCVKSGPANFIINKNEIMIATSSTPTLPICPITGANMDYWIYIPCDWRRPSVEQEYHLYWSNDSQYGELSPRPSRVEVASFYEVEYYTHTDGSNDSAVRHPSFFGRLQEHLAWRLDYGTDITAKSLSKLVPPQRHPSVLEIGCGDGKLLAALQANGWRGVGIEPDPVARRVASDRGVEVHEGTAEDPPGAIEGESFDLIVMQHVLEHCLDPLKALRFAASCLKPHAVIVIETPNNAAIGAHVAGAVWPWIDAPRHLNFFTERSLRKACDVAHLNAVGVEYTGYTRQFQLPWIRNEQLICRTFNKINDRYKASTYLARWKLLLRAGLSQPCAKYDSVRIIARPSDIFSGPS
jgi:SAM-dependent methyltransferase